MCQKRVSRSCRSWRFPTGAVGAARSRDGRPPATRIRGCRRPYPCGLGCGRSERLCSSVAAHLRPASAHSSASSRAAKLAARASATAAQVGGGRLSLCGPESALLEQQPAGRARRRGDVWVAPWMSASCRVRAARSQGCTLARAVGAGRAPHPAGPGGLMWRARHTTPLCARSSAARAFPRGCCSRTRPGRGNFAREPGSNARRYSSAPRPIVPAGGAVAFAFDACDGEYAREKRLLSSKGSSGHVARRRLASRWSLSPRFPTGRGTVGCDSRSPSAAGLEPLLMSLARSIPHPGPAAFRAEPSRFIASATASVCMAVWKAALSGIPAMSPTRCVGLPCR